MMKLEEIHHSHQPGLLEDQRACLDERVGKWRLGGSQIKDKVGVLQRYGMTFGNINGVFGYMRVGATNCTTPCLDSGSW